MTAREWLLLARAVQRWAAQEAVFGIVITHGTDTMEETAFCFNLVLKMDKPVVLTGAMRPATALSADGPLNLLNAVRVAVSEKSRSCGVLIAMNGLIGSARETAKTQTVAVETFSGRVYGLLGHVIGDRVEHLSRTDRPHTMQTEFSLEDAQAWLLQVDLILAHANDDGVLVRASAAAGSAGIVHAGAGNGSISAPVERDLMAAAGKGVLIVRASRAGAGPVTGGHDRWQKAGFIPARTLSPQKAAILL